MRKLFFLAIVLLMGSTLWSKSGTYKYEINPRTNKFDITGYTNYTPSSNTITTDGNQTITGVKTVTSSATFTNGTLQLRNCKIVGGESSELTINQVLTLTGAGGEQLVFNNTTTGSDNWDLLQASINQDDFVIRERIADDGFSPWLYMQANGVTAKCSTMTATGDQTWEGTIASSTGTFANTLRLTSGLTTGAMGANTGTMTNCPNTGNPTTWLRIMIGTCTGVVPWFQTSP